MENPFKENEIRKPAFLIVLCVLTFIGSGWGVMSNLFSMFMAGIVNPDVQIEQFSEVIGAFENQRSFSMLSGFIDSSMQYAMAEAAHAKEIAIVSFVLEFISLTGAILMFQLRRLGFYFYAAAQVLLLFVLPYFVGFQLVALVIMFLSGIFTLLFIVLYGLNLKYMK